MFGRYSTIGAAEARILVDLSQARQSASQFRTIAQQIRQSLVDINKSMGSTGSLASKANSDSVKLQIQNSKLLTDQMRREREELARLNRERERSARSASAVPKQMNFFKEFDGLVRQEEQAQKQKVARAAAIQRQYYDQELARRRAFNRELNAAPLNNSFSEENQFQRGLSKRAADAQRKATQEEVKAEQERRRTLQNEIRLTAQTLTEQRANLRQQQGRFNTASADAPSNLQRGGVTKALAEARQPLDDLQARFQRLKTRITELAGQPAQQMKLIRELQNLRRESDQVQTGINRAAASISNFQAAANRARSGMQGYFNSVRENLERINEVSLAANLQEISFRLLPMGLAMGAIAKEGTSAALQIEEMNLGMAAFTGSSDRAVDLMAELRQQAGRFGLPMMEVQQVMQRFLPIIRQTGNDFNRIIELAARLRTLNPAQGFEGAMFSITEAMASGEGGLDAISLRERFGIVPRILREAIAETGSLADGLDQVLNGMGRTAELAAQFGETSRASLTRLRDSWQNFLATAMRPTVDAMAEISDRMTEFLDGLKASGSPLAPLIGGFVSLASVAISALIAIGQMSLAFMALKALLPSTTAQVAANTAAVTANTAASTANAGSTGLMGAARGAAGTVGGAIASAAPIVLTGAAAVAVGAVIGQQIAVYLEGRGIVAEGESDPASLWNRLKQSVFLAISAISEPFFVGASVIKAGIDAIGTAIDLIATVIAKGVNDIALSLIGVVQDIGNKFNVEALKGFGGDLGAMYANSASRFVVTRGNGEQFVSGAAGVQANTNEQIERHNELIVNAGLVYGDSIEFIEGYTERLERLRGELENPPSIEGIVTSGLEAARTFMRGVFGVMFPESAAGSGGGSANAPRNANAGLSTLSDDQLEKAYGLLVNNMIQMTRQAEDEARAAAREMEDFFIGRTRALEDFARQQAQALEDFMLDRQERIDDFNAQVTEMELEANDDRQKRIDEFNKEEKRRQEDHLRSMIRAARDVDDAIAARDFLAAQKALQNMRDEEEDFKIETQRRREDFEAQLKDLDDNLNKQRDKRKRDFDKQLQDMQVQFDRRRQREIADFNLRLSREDQDRALRMAREEQDRQIRNFRQQQDFQIQLAQLMDHNRIMQEIWNGGLNILRQKTIDFFNAFNNTVVIGGGDGGIGIGGGDLPTPYAVGSPGLPRDMFIRGHKREIIIPATFSDAITRGDLTLSGRDGSGGAGEYHFHFDLRGTDMSDEHFISLAENVIIPKIERTIRDTAREHKNRGRS